MRLGFIKSYWQFKRFLLKKLVPEIIWPKQVMLDGVSFPVRNSPYSAGTKYILSTGKYEWPERKLLSACIKPGDTIIEMGGSIGVLTAIIANRIGPSGKLISIEASESLVAYSASWLEKNNNTKVINGYAFPLYDCAKRIKIIAFDESAGALAGVVSFEWLSNENSAAIISANPVKIFDLKTIASQFNIEPNVLVVDIEGSERILLDDEAAFSYPVEYILIELHPAQYGVKIKEDIVSKIKRLGYDVERMEENTYLFKKQQS